MPTRCKAQAVLIAALLAAAAVGQDAAPTIDQQLIELRQGLAQAQLELQRSKAQLEELRVFLAEKNLDDQLEAWRAEREALAEERRKLAMERKRLESARTALHRKTTVDAMDRAKAEREQKQQAADAIKPDFSVQYMMGLIDKDRQTIFVESTRGTVLVDQFPQVDRKNIKVRGTFLNKSQAPWRYTFEIRAAGETNIYGERAIVGQWRHQTPLLGPGEMHEFEVTVPVTNVRDVEVIQVGNVTSDRPPQPDPQPQPAD